MSTGSVVVVIVGVFSLGFVLLGCVYLALRAEAAGGPAPCPDTQSGRPHQPQ